MQRASPAPTVRVVQLVTPPAARLVPEGVFDAFGWCASDTLEWRAPQGRCGRWDEATPIDGSDPARMVFVTRPGVAAFLPRELACVHALGFGLTDEEALAPWAIDDATDELYARRVRPRDALWLAADNLNALFWGLHDWAHFHSHGAFEPQQRAWTELQCDATALAWLWQNRARVPLAEATWERVRGEAVALSRARFEANGQDFDAGWLAAARLRTMTPVATEPTAPTHVGTSQA
ncbi:MAG TPA: hypothetical protein VIF15_06625 [Polyangiaceae bacterium]